MKIESVNGLESSARPVGAAVVRSPAHGGVTLELGPADGPPAWRISFSMLEAERCADAIRHTISTGDEAILILDD